MTAQARLLGGRYQVGELLGYGGMAEVHRGRDLRLGRDVAIKMLRTDLARDKTFQERFRREAQNAAALNHPAIVAVYDTGEERAPTGEALPFIVMEFVNGRTLKEVLANEGRLMPRRALEITADICAALEFSHRHGIIHRDIKPGNVMLNQNSQVKVMDFGIARALASGATTMTQTSAVIGTAQYLSPEQARGEAVDARSDVYAAGCVLFELLCGHPPFVGDSPVSVAYQHVREDPRPPSYINPEVGSDIDAVVLKALAKNPLNRYQSAAEMRSDLLRAAAGRPVMATPVMSEDETMAMAAAQTRPISPPRPVARVGDQRRRRASAWVLAALSALGVLAVVALIAGLLMSGQGNQEQPVSVPGVLNLTPEQATERLRAAGLGVTTGDPVQEEGCQEGRVAAQIPEEGTDVNEGDFVTIRICAGPGEVVVPGDLVGGRWVDVKARLESLGLRPERVEVNSSRPEDIVTGVEGAGETVEKNSTVRVEVSNNRLRAVPDLEGMTREQAERALENADLRANVVAGPEDAERAGEVIEQNPAAGEEIEVNSRVRIVIAQEPEEEPEPTQEPTATPTPTPPPGDGGGGGD